MEQRKRPPRWESEELVFEQPDPKKIHCSDCKYREPDRKLPNGRFIRGATLYSCLLGVKPKGVLWGGSCENYEPERAN